MKRWIVLLMTAMFTFPLAACSGGETQETSEQDPADSEQVSEEEVLSETDEEVSMEEETGAEGTAEETADTNMLVAYFSYVENADLPDGVDASSTASIQVWNDEITGNTGVVAAMIADAAGADMFSIVTVEKYPATYDATIDQGQEERNADARPELATHVENLDDYDVIFLGFPNWWGDMPMIIYTFLDEYDLSGKTVAPFNTSGGSGFSNSLETIAEMEPDAQITEGLSLGSSEAGDCADTVSTWLDSIGLAE